MSTDLRSRAWVEVDAGALVSNVAAVRASLPRDTGLLPMVKADAYGLGVARTVAALEPLEPWGYGIATVDEGCGLRELGVVRPIVVFSPSGIDEIPAAREARLTLTVSHPSALERLRRIASEEDGGVPDSSEDPGFHLEVDTGMGRAGFDDRRVESWAPLAQAVHEAGIPWRGVFTHFHSADEPDGQVPTAEQLRRFRSTLELLASYSAAQASGFLRHVANSAASFAPGQGEWDLARPGIFLYGGRPGPGTPPPEPVVSLRARIIHLKEARRGDTVGYGATHVAGEGARWATVACGYGDGLPRALSNRGSALVRGVRVPVVGRISMDVTVVDISRVPSASLGEVVTFLGCDGDEEITLDEVATLAGTISYEILTGLTPRLPRVWA